MKTRNGGRIQRWNRRILAGVFLLYCILTLALAVVIGPIVYEAEENTIPIISLEYRGSTFINEGDLALFERDFPELYPALRDVDFIKDYRYIVLSEERWMPYYYPLYPALCLPVKVALQALHLDQTRCFTITNAFLVILAMTVVYRAGRLSDNKKAFILLFLMCCPGILYVRYIGYEVCMFSFAAISMALYVTGRRKPSAFFLSLAGMPNPTIMAAGFVMIGEYFMEVFREHRGMSLGAVVKACYKETLLYAACFIPCLIPVAYQVVLTGKILYLSNGAASENREYIGRVLEYWFDPNLGILAFAPWQIMMAFALFLYGLVRWKREMLRPVIFPTAAILAVSLMGHINCGMVTCSRYVVWIYPLLAVPLGYALDEIVTLERLKRGACLFMACTSTLLILYNGYYYSLEYNKTTTAILDNVPQLYNPLFSTFASRTECIDGAYDYSEPVYYMDRRDHNYHIRKLSYTATEESIQRIMARVSGSEEAVSAFRDKLNRIGADGKRHYINIPVWSKQQVFLADEYSMGTPIVFSSFENTSAYYLREGFSAAETWGTWTDGGEAVMRLKLSGADGSTIRGRIDLTCAVSLPRELRISVNREEVYHDTVYYDDVPIQFEFPCPEDRVVTLVLQLPDALSPAEQGVSDDTRQLGLGIFSIEFENSTALPWIAAA